MTVEVRDSAKWLRENCGAIATQSNGRKRCGDKRKRDGATYLCGWHVTIYGNRNLFPSVRFDGDEA